MSKKTPKQIPNTNWTTAKFLWIFSIKIKLNLNDKSELYVCHFDINGILGRLLISAKRLHVGCWEMFQPFYTILWSLFFFLLSIDFRVQGTVLLFILKDHLFQSQLGILSSVWKFRFLDALGRYFSIMTFPPPYRILTTWKLGSWKIGHCSIKLLKLSS